MEGKLAVAEDVILPSFVSPKTAESDDKETASYFRILPISDFLQFAAMYEENKKDPHRNHREAEKFRPSEQYFGNVNIMDNTLDQNSLKVTTVRPEHAVTTEITRPNVFKPSFFKSEPALPIIQDNGSDREVLSNYTSSKLPTSEPYIGPKTTVSSVDQSRNDLPFNSATPSGPSSTFSPIAQSKSGLFDFKIPPRRNQQTNFQTMTHQTDFNPSEAHSTLIGPLSNNGFLLTPQDQVFPNHPELEYLRPNHENPPQVPESATGLDTSSLHSTSNPNTPLPISDFDQNSKQFQLTSSHSPPHIGPTADQFPSAPHPSVQTTFLQADHQPGSQNLFDYSPQNFSPPQQVEAIFNNPPVSVQDQDAFPPYPSIAVHQSPTNTLDLPRRGSFIPGHLANHNILPNKKYETSNHPNRLPVTTSSSYGSSHGTTGGYNYAYSVDGGTYGPVFHKQEENDGLHTEGEYSVRLPDGRLQVVQYTVKGKQGYRAKVSYH